jgi:hypothetical protein
MYRARALVAEYVARPLRYVVAFAGKDLYLRTADREILEARVLPWLATQPDIKKVIFVGCDWYTRGYRKFFTSDGYWTIDIDPAKRRWGARQHVVDSITNLQTHFPREGIDAIVCNGVIGWGLNEPEEIYQALDACYACLRAGGHLVLGWNDLAERSPVPVEASALGRGFSAVSFPPLEAHRVTTAPPWRHTFAFFRK